MENYEDLQHKIKELKQEKRAIEEAYDEQASELGGITRLYNNLRTSEDIRLEKGRQKKARKAKSRHFTKVYQYAFDEVAKCLTPDEGYLILRVLPYIEHRTNVLVSDKREMAAKDIQKLTPWCERKVRDVLKGLVSKKVLFRTETGRQNSYRASKKYFFVGDEAHNDWKDEETTPAQTRRNTGTSTPQ